MSKRHWRFEWLKMERTAEGNGGSPKTYTSQGYLWGKITLDSAAETEIYRATRTTVYGTVTLRNFPEVSMKDRLVFVNRNQTYLIDGVREDFANNATICDVRRLDVEG